MENFKEKLKKMNSEQIPRETIINIILYMTILIMPLIVVNVSSPRYVLGKLMFLYVAGFFLLVNLILDNKIKFKKEHIIVLLFLATILISCIFSPYKVIAFFGTKERSEGFVTIAIYILLFIASSQYLKITEKSINLILTIVNIHAIYGIFQFYNFDPIQKWALGGIGVSDSIGLLGNRMYFSIYMLLFLTFSASSYIAKGNKKYLVSSLICGATLICTLTRASYLSFISVFVLELVINLILRRKEILKRFLILMLIFSISCIVLNVTSAGKVTGRIEHTFTEINEISNRDDNTNTPIFSSINSRYEIWKLYIQAFKDKPLLGTGPDTFISRLSDEYPLEYARKLIITGEGADKAHNEYLEYATSCGVFTVIAYVALILCIILNLFKNIKNDRNQIILSMIFAYLIQAFFSISLICVAPLFWILLGYATQIKYEKTS
ncbi:MAG: O-antigen ligase family protein, partial [Bacilli bacterium]|nr:O-antigen ligase family protein [Bacilli bacterium]